MPRVDADVHGFLIVDKPAGVTSHDVVRHIRKALGTRKVGHAGTLDPTATGVLVVGVGAATRLLRFVESTTKTYDAVVRFGARTTTLDADGDIVDRAPAGHLTPSDVEGVLERFRGEIQQVPPMVSALKVDGERLHAKARRGEEVVRAPRAVTIHELTLTSFEAGDEPSASLTVVCSSGTYVRTLADDLGVALGTYAHLAALRRTAVGTATIERAVQLTDVSAASLLPVGAAVDLPIRELSEEEAVWIRNGRRIEPRGGGLTLATTNGQLVAVLDDDGTRTRIEVGLASGASLPV